MKITRARPAGRIWSNFKSNPTDYSTFFNIRSVVNDFRRISPPPPSISKPTNVIGSYNNRTARAGGFRDVYELWTTNTILLGGVRPAKNIRTDNIERAPKRNKIIATCHRNDTRRVVQYRFVVSKSSRGLRGRTKITLS